LAFSLFQWNMWEGQWGLFYRFTPIAFHDVVVAVTPICWRIASSRRATRASFRRIAAPLTHELALKLPHWRECLGPIAARLAQTFRESLLNKNLAPRTLAAKSGNKRRTVPGPERSPLLATPRKVSQPRPYATRAWRAPTVETRPGRNRRWARER
jgi:hypothetical protein